MNSENEFKELLRSIKRPNANIEGLIDKLETSDFFYAPASTRYNGSFRGGLVKHSLNVYNNLKELVESKGLNVDNDSIIILGLLHDFSKMNLFTESVRNKKEYTINGTKHDALGNFDWVSEKSFVVKDDEERFIYGNSEETSEFMIRNYIPLTVEESVAILHHLGGKGWDSTQTNIPTIYSRYPLACLLHTAEMLSVYIDEKK